MQYKKYLIRIVITLMISLVSVLLLLSEGFDRWERGVYDTLCRQLLVDETSDKVALILVDTKSLDWGNEYYKKYPAFEKAGYLQGAELPASAYLWPWDRTAYGQVIEFLASGGARAVVFDMEFASYHRIVEGDNTLGAYTQFMNEEGKTYVVHTINFHESETPPKDSMSDLELSNLKSGGISVDGLNDSPFLFNRSERGFYYSPILPNKEIAFEELSEHLRLGAVCAQPDEDAVVRRARVLVSYKDWTYPSLGAAAVLAYLESKNGKGSARFTTNEDGLVLEDLHSKKSFNIPLSPTGDIYVRWKDTGEESYAGEGRFKTYPAYRVLLSAMNNNKLIENMTQKPEGFAIDPAEFKDKIVFFGASAQALYDLKATPVSKNYPGVKVHAAVAENLLDEEIIRRGSVPLRAAIVFLVSLITIVSCFFSKKAYIQVVTTFVLMAVYATITYTIFTMSLLCLDMIAPLACILIAYMGGTTYSYFTEGRHKREITRMFAQYVPPKVVDSLVANPDALNTRGVRIEVTVFFSDIKGFTTISNTKQMREDPELLTQHLNEYLTEMTTAIHDIGGTLDKYIGDAVVAFFGAPLPMKNHAEAACKAAIECQRRLMIFNKKAAEKGLPELPTRIGLFTGEAIIGNVGSSVRLSYTAIGATMNFGARLEGVNKVYGTWIMAGEQTVKMAGENIRSRFIDSVRVPGILDEAPPLRIHQVVDIIDKNKKSDDKLYSMFQEAMAEYESGHFEKALPIFELCVEEFNDPPSKVFLERTQVLIGEPPDDWDGVWRIKSK